MSSSRPAGPALEQRSLDVEQLSEQFAAAADRSGEILERTYSIGGQRLRLRYAGPALPERLSPSIEHLRAEGPGDGEHVVMVWDGQTTGTAAPPVPPGAEDLPPAGIATSTQGARRTIYQAGVRTLSVFDADLDRSWYWAAGADELPEWESSTPLRHILHLWLASRGVQFVHSGAVGRPGGGCIIVGKSGSGKSTTTLSTLGSDLLYAGDDYVGVSLDESGAWAHSIYGCGKLETGHVARFPDLRINVRQERADTVRARRDKAIFYVRDTYPAQVTTGFPLKAIVVPRIFPGETTALTPISVSAACKALIPSTMFEIHGAGQAALTMLIQVAQRVSTYELRLGADIEAIPHLLGEMLDRS